MLNGRFLNDLKEGSLYEACPEYRATNDEGKMTPHPYPFQVIDWNTIHHTKQTGETGTALWQTTQLPGLRIRIVTYSAGYLADHWCHKGHVVHCLEGELITEQENGERFVLKKGMTYVVSDGMSSHRSRTAGEVRLLIMDGEFLRQDLPQV